MTARDQRQSSYANFERPPGFVFRRRHRGEDLTLHCEEASLTRLAERYGTPLYVYSAAAIRQRLDAFEKAFRGAPHTICYSVKANSNLHLLRQLAREGCGFDVVSGGELQRVLAVAPRAAKQTVFSGVGKTREEMAAALRAGILLFNLESESELRALAETAAAMRTAARIALRVNPDVAADTHPYISTGLHKHKFGLPIAQARALYAKAAQNDRLQVAGVSVHIGSQIKDVAPFGEALARVADLVRDLRADGHRIEYVDAGGGLGIDYDKPQRDFASHAASYARVITRALRGLKVHLLLEPGRAIAGPSGILLTRVLYRKRNDGKRFLIVDAAMNDLIRPSLYGAHHQIAPVRLSSGAFNETETTDVVGPVCETGDFFARNREMPAAEEGDLLVILDAGAYGMVLASNYNTRPRPAEVLISGKSVKVIRQREKVSDLFAAEL